MTATPRSLRESTLTVINNVLREATPHRLSKTEYDQAIRALNTHDRAKAAIKAVLAEYDRSTMFDANGSKFDDLKAVLAKLEGGK